MVVDDGNWRDRLGRIKLWMANVTDCEGKGRWEEWMNVDCSLDIKFKWWWWDKRRVEQCFVIDR